MLGTVGIVIAALVVIALIAAAFKPPRFRVERSAQIAAPPAAVYPLVSDFRRWTAWSPWEDIDADLSRTYSGADSGPGAAYAWEGKKAGSGRMEITNAAPPGRLGIQLDFTKPFEAHNQTEFTFDPAGGGTRVSWAMTGTQPYMLRVISLFMSMDRMVGKDFEKGLVRLKAAAEGSSQPSTPAR